MTTLIAEIESNNLWKYLNFKLTLPDSTEEKHIIPYVFSPIFTIFLNIFPDICDFIYKLQFKLYLFIKISKSK